MARSRFAAALLGLWLASVLAGGVMADDLSDAQDRGTELLRAGRYAEALPHFEKALDLAEARFGPEDPAVANDLNNLAETQRLLQRYDNAEQLYLRAIMIDERQRGADDPGLAATLNNLALVYKAQGRYPDAERLYLRSLAILEKALGPNSPDVAKSLNNLAVLYRTQGQVEKARPLQERALVVAEKVLGRDNVTTRTLRRNLAALGGSGAAPGRAAAPATAKPAARPAPASRPAAAASTARPAAGPPAAAPAGGFAIHLASIRERADVEAEWRSLVAKYPGIARLGLRPVGSVTTDKGTFYRIAAGSFASRDEAARACAPVKAAGGYCAVLAP